MAAPIVDESAIRRINAASTLLPRVRDLRLLLDILENHPLRDDTADRILEVEEELRAAETQVVDALLDA